MGSILIPHNEQSESEIAPEILLSNVLWSVVLYKADVALSLSEVRQHKLLEGKLGFCWMWYVQLYFGAAECIGVASVNSQTCMPLEVLTSSCGSTVWLCPPISWLGSSAQAVLSSQSRQMCHVP